MTLCSDGDVLLCVDISIHLVEADSLQQNECFLLLFTSKSRCLFFSTENLVGTHDAPIRCVEYCPEVNVMVTGSWDQTVKLWDPRTPCNAGTFSQPEKVGSLYS